MRIPNGITYEDVVQAIVDLDGGVEHGFGESTGYDVFYKGRRYPPKAVIGLAARRIAGRPLTPHDFGGGERTRCFRELRRLRFSIVPKYDFNGRDNATYFEISNSGHNHGGKGWEFGTCLWSPTKNQRNADRYSLMREPQLGDEIIHFYRQILNGREDTYIAGVSRVVQPYVETNEEPPSPGQWAGLAPYYRIELEQYRPFDNPLSVRQFADDYADEIRNDLEVNKPRFYPFNTYGDGIRTVQGIYLARATASLRHILEQATSLAANEREGDEVDPHAVYREARRLARERYFFSRNPKLAREAKQRYGYRCQVCQFSFSDTYGAIGSEYIEAHHLDPLSERSESDWPEELTTSIDRVAVLCANCHRMIHRHRPALSLDELRKAMSPRAATTS